ncbi:hypothetical protein FRX31_029975 [Thalictrum thalictroides]|uniref:Uncharacterized protein n=1 Tax=Thalictrum thalictroides TaxID=46969 RepID=A0A7J6V715_THATH|nr:hypothetical protein FRX31_029975 [Thalictrum thalictroides]
MSEEDKLFNFICGLQEWAQSELRRYNLKDLPSAIAAADRLVDFKAHTSSSAEDGEKKNWGKTGSKGCFICDGPHLAKACPRREELDVLETEGESDEESDEVSKENSDEGESEENSDEEESEEESEEEEAVAGVPE